MLFAGRQLTPEEVLSIAFAAGFQNEEQLISVLHIAIKASDLWTQARNWQPELGLREENTKIGIEGPTGVWRDHRQMHSNRGLWQISSFWWSDLLDSTVDDPEAAAAAIFTISSSGTDFSFWQNYLDETDETYFDEAHGNWPAIRPLVRDFLSRTEANELAASDASSSSAIGETSEASETEETLTEALEEPSQSERPIAALERAAKAGNAWAMIGLADLLAAGEEVDADPDRALSLLENAAASGLEGPARGALGAYYRAIGDYEKALKLLDQAAEAGDGWAAFRLAEMIAEGQGTQPDEAKAAEPFGEAAASGLTGGKQEKVDLALQLMKGKKADRDRASTLLEGVRLEETPGAYAQLIAVSAADFRRNLPLDHAITLLRQAREADASVAFQAFRSLPENEKVALAQAILKSVGIYSGKTNGKLTKSTLQAIGRFCRRNGIDECKSEAMPDSFISALIERISTGG